MGLRFFQIKIWGPKRWPVPPLNWGCPSFCQNAQLRLQRQPAPPFRVQYLWSRGYRVDPPRTFLPSRTTSMANFIAIHPVVWISIESKQTHTHTHCSWFGGWLNVKECNEVNSTILGGIILRKLHYGAFDRWSGLVKYQVGRCPIYCHSVLTDDQMWINQIHLITRNESFACTIIPAAYYYAAATTTIPIVPILNRCIWGISWLLIGFIGSQIGRLFLPFWSLVDVPS